MMNTGELSCPLRGRSVEDRDALRVHLTCRHRESELTDAALAPLDDEPIPA